MWCFLYVGTEIYQETMGKAVAKQFDARFLLVDCLLLLGVSQFVSIVGTSSNLVVSHNVRRTNTWHVDSNGSDSIRL